MKNLQEYKTEIFRRSEEKLRQRKRRRIRLAACCVPLCLCLALALLIEPSGIDGWETSPESGNHRQTMETTEANGVTVEMLTPTGATAGTEAFPGSAAGTSEPVPVDFEVRYIRTNGYHDRAAYPIVTVISSREALDDYYEKNRELYDLERRNDPAMDYTAGFLDACDSYDSSYFEENALVLVLLEEGSGSVRHKVTGVQSSGDQLRVDVKSIVPEVFTDDMAQWHIFLEVKKEAVPSDSQDVQVYYNGKLTM